MSELFDSLNFAGAGVGSSQASQPTTSRVYWHASPSPAFLSTRNGTPSKLREHESPTVPPLCTQAFLGELKKVSTAANANANVASTRLALGSPASPKARGKRRADPRTLAMDGDGLSDDDDDDDDEGGAAKGNHRLFLGEIDESSPETRRRRTMDAGHTGRLRKSPASSVDATSQPQQARRADESLDSELRGGSSSVDSSTRRNNVRRADSAVSRDVSTSSASARRMLRRSRCGTKRQNPAWMHGLGIDTADSPLSLLAMPLGGGAGAKDDSMAGQSAPQTAKKLFEDLTAVLDESCNAVRRRQDSGLIRRGNEATTPQPSSAPLGNKLDVRDEESDVDMQAAYDDHVQRTALVRNGLARSASVPSRGDTTPSVRGKDRAVPAMQYEDGGDDASDPPVVALGGCRTLNAVRSHNDVYASDRSEAAHQQRQQQVREFASVSATRAHRDRQEDAARGPTAAAPPPRPLSSRSNLPSRAPSIPPKSSIKVIDGASPGGPDPNMRTSRCETRRKLGTRPPAIAAPRQSQTLATTTTTTTTTPPETVDLTMDGDYPESDHASFRSTSPRKSHTPSPIKPLRQASIVATTTTTSAVVPPGRSRSTGSATSTKAALGMGKISASCLSQARQPGLARSSQCVLASQRLKRATTSDDGRSGGIRMHAAAAAAAASSQRNRSSPSAPFRPPAKTRLVDHATVAPATASGSRTSVHQTRSKPQPTPAPQPQARGTSAHIGSDDSFGLSDTDDAAFASLASELGF